MPESKPVAIDVVSYDSGDTRGKSERTVDKVERGRLINMDRKSFFTCVRYEALP